MAIQNRSARDETVTENPGKSKATKSSQVRAQSWWRPSRLWEASVECRWHGKVARKRENLHWRKTTTTTTNITKTSWRFSQAEYDRCEFCWVRLRSKLSYLKRTKASIKKMITEVLSIFSLYLILFFIWLRFRHLIKIMASVGDILNDNGFFGDVVDTPKEGIEQHKKRECL